MPVYEIKTNRAVEAFVKRMRRQFFYSLAALAGIVVISTIGLVVLGDNNKPIPEQIHLALWDTLNLISTVGSLDTLSVGQRIWAMLIIVFGLGAVLLAFGTLMGLLQGGDVHRHLVRKKMNRTLEEFKDHIVLCGYGVVGREVARHVEKSHHELVVIERDENSVAAADADGHFVIHADCTDEATLREAGLKRAAGLIATLDSDSANVFLILIAREINSDLRIVTRAERESSRSTLRRAGANRVIVPGETAGLQLSNLVLKPHMSEFIASAVGEGEYDFAEIDVAEYPGLCDKALRDLDLPRKAGVIIISIINADGDQEFSPGADRVVTAGDTLLIVSRMDSFKRIVELGK